MSIDNFACLILGLNRRQLDLDKKIQELDLPGLGDDWSIEDFLDELNDKLTLSLTEQRDNKNDSYIGFTLARTESYGMCEVPSFDEQHLGSIFVGLFGIPPKLWLIEQQD